MAAIVIKRATQTTQQSRTSTTYAGVSGASIANTEFVTGDKYLILVTAQVGGGNNHGRAVRLVHGSTAFAESEQQDAGADAALHCYQFMTVWTAVSSEGLSLEFKGLAGGQTCTVDQAEIIAIRLSSDLVENTDWYFNERTNDDGLSTTPVDGASLTFTPSESGNWLVLSYAQVSHTDLTTSSISSLNRSGEASSSTPEARCEAAISSPAGLLGYLLSRVFALTAASNTFKEISTASSGTAHTRLHSSVFALRLGAFDQNVSAYTDGDTNLGTSDFGTALQSVSVTPNATGDFVIGGYWGFDVANLARTAKWRLQAAGSDAPGTQTSDAYNFRAKDSTDERPLTLITVATLTSGASRTLTLDGSTSSTTNTPTGQHRSLWAFSAELAAGEEQLPPTIVADTADESVFNDTTPTLLFTGTDQNTVEDDLRYQIQITDNPSGFTGGEVVTTSLTSGSGTPIHPNPGGGTTWEGHRQVDDRPGMSFQGTGGVLDSVDFYFGPHESSPSLTDGDYLVHVYRAVGHPVHPVPATWAATTAYSVGNIVRPTSTANGNLHFVYRCKTAGTSHSSEPSWPGNGVAWKSVTELGETSDGSVVWETLAGMHPENPADPGDTPTPGWLAVSDIYPYNPGSADAGWKTIEFSGANRIRLEEDEWYIAILDWRPNDGNANNTLQVTNASLSNAVAPGNMYIDGGEGTNNGARIIEDSWYRVRESFVLLDKVSGTDSGFANVDNGGDTDPFTSGDQISFTVQAGDALLDALYYWHVRAKDPGGSDTWSSYTATRTFTVDTDVEDVTVSVSAGALTLAGQSAVVVPGGVTIAVAAGTVTLAGQSAALQATVTVALSTGALTLAGQAATVVPGGVTIAVGAAALAITGQGASVDSSASVATSAGTMTLAGQAATVVPGGVTIAVGAAATLSLVGQSASADGSAIIGATVGALSLAGQSAVVVPGGVPIAAAAGTLALAGQSAVVQVGSVMISAQAGTLALSGQSAAVAVGAVTVAMQAGTLSLSGAQAQVQPGSVMVVANAAAVTLAGQNATVGSEVPSIVINAAAGTVALAGQNAVVVPGPVVVAMTVAALSLLGAAAAALAGSDRGDWTVTEGVRYVWTVSDTSRAS